MIKAPEQLCKKLGLTFNQPEWFVLALTHRSMGAKNNERLEFLGDSILGFVIAEALFERFPKASEGVLSRLRASLVNQESLAELARLHKLGDYLILGSGELKSGGYRRASILSDAVEAIMGAIIKDQGTESCKTWVLDLFADRIAELRLDNWQKDPKTRLQEHMQARQLDVPCYTLISQSGLPHEQTFKVECSVALFEKKFIGAGVSRKKAEQQSAELMLDQIARESK
ncbi:ribonuclease III [Bathymodiolus platifrons methanotrophic gill symbiont]|uniref:ribonuclease III n=1 Tax=Bathymodiolus platifrons methanotrophic gill symbiont TaxID=113268 RepID=UPI000B4175DC|nr:ribonuclease III [Bathymodiolus platifrons methanotrophic gill symbiont]GAW84869.1 ribonuclease III [Bathymodiolus platifrons methanotrophic gill symbiont]